MSAKYVYLEMIHDKGTAQDVVSGLFKGFYVRNNITYVLLEGKKSCTTVLNVNFYKIMTIEVLEQDYKNMTFVTAESSDQREAMKQLQELHNKLLEAGFAYKQGSTILDVAKYEQVPKEYFDGAPPGSGRSAGGVVNNAGSFASNRNRYGKGATGTSYVQTPVKPDPTPTFFERTKSKKPTKEALELMAEKIDAIRNGQAQPDIPEIIGPVETDAESSAADTEEYGLYGSYYRGVGSMC